MLPGYIPKLTPAAAAPSRRGFLLAAAAVGGGLAVGFRAAEAAETLPQAQAPFAHTQVNPFSAYLTITPDSLVVVHSAHMDMGQGPYHGLATLVAEELGADWAQMRADGGWGNTQFYGNLAWGGAMQGTGGSTAIASSFDRYRQAGAAAREMLIAAASSAWKVPKAEITVDKGFLVHASGRRAPFGEIVGQAAAVPIPSAVPLKEPKDWTFIGNPKLPRIDSREKSTGREQFTIDVKLPGMLTAVMLHPPLFGATQKSFDASKAKAVKGFVEAVATPRGVAVVAENMWAAMKAREAVTVEWDESKAEKRSTAELAATYRDLAARPGTVARNEGDVDGAFAKAAKVIEATFEFPYLAHAALEPLNAVAARGADGFVEVWGGHQMPDLYQAAAAQVAGTTPDKVRLHVMKTGGSFGRRAVPDADVIVEAVAVAKALGWRAPVKLQWTREDDTRAGRYRPMYVHALKAGIDADGKLVAWQNRIVGQSIVAGTPFAQGMVKNGIDVTSVEGAATIPYAIPNLRVELTTTEVGVPVLWWRAVGSTHTAYAVEAFLDEVAEAAGKDPVALRLDLLKEHPRHAGALRLAAEKADWSRPLPAGRFRGVAVA
ncbi:MAG TPA: molybdopterin cofactor-binding domain-containing protein, partial [Beijerinckiaceae bacterium]|nr:molybdopterin cofactor-binding domain-containing protein [Beijerinckiaceae bacterium]